MNLLSCNRIKLLTFFMAGLLSVVLIVSGRMTLCYTELGIKAAIAKPFQPLELAREIAQVLGWDQE
jgi:hypothetical protein